MACHVGLDVTRYGAPTVRPDDRDPVAWVVTFAGGPELLPVGEARIRCTVEQLAALTRLAKKG